MPKLPEWSDRRATQHLALPVVADPLRRSIFACKCRWPLLRGQPYEATNVKANATTICFVRLF
jgi:hypothetical protein